MKLRRIAAFPLGWALIWVPVLALTPDDLRSVLLRTETESAKVLALTGCIAAASRFSRGDYLRKAWSLHAICFSLLLMRDALGLWFCNGPDLFGLTFDYVQATMICVANAAAIVGTFLASRVWQVGGIALPGSRVARGATIGAAVLVALAITGRAAWSDLQLVLSGNVHHLVPLTSDVGDIVSLCLVAPVFLTALALRGGILMWPWALLTASLMGWLLYDAASTFGPHVFAAPMAARMTTEVFRAFACTFAFAAGLAQRAVLHQEGPDGLEAPRGLGLSQDQ